MCSRSKMAISPERRYLYSFDTKENYFTPSLQKLNSVNVHSYITFNLKRNVLTSEH